MKQFIESTQVLEYYAKEKGISTDYRGLKLRTSELYVAGKLNISGRYSNLLEGLTIPEIGKTNFDGNRLAMNRFLVADSITVLYGEASDNEKLFNVDFTKKLPTQLLASNLVIRQGAKVLFKMPVAAIENAKLRNGQYYRDLESYLILEPSEAIEIGFETPIGAQISDLGGKTPYVKVLLKGFESETNN